MPLVNIRCKQPSLLAEHFLVDYLRGTMRFVKHTLKSLGSVREKKYSRMLYIHKMTENTFMMIENIFY